MARTPEVKFRLGFVTASVWSNDGNGESTFYTVTLQRSFKNGDGHYKNTDGLNAGDLLNAAKVLERAEAWISAQ